jgi:hypothetical protein
MLRLDRNYENIEVGRPFMKMSTNWEAFGTCKTQTSPMATRSRTKWRLISASFVMLVLNGVGREVDNADVIIVDESALCQRSVEFLK